jgi:hypothetical protein
MDFQSIEGDFAYPLIGQGSRRSCYRMPGGKLCVKFYHDLRELPARTHLSVRREIKTARFFRAVNVNFQEWRYYQGLCKRLTAEQLSVFPEHVELAFSESRGWGIIESLVVNPDGTPAQRLSQEIAQIDDPALRLRIYRETEKLLDLIVKQKINFFDMSNLLLQWTGEKTFRLRIADFEPYGRGAWCVMAFCSFLSQCKVRRRADRFLARLRRTVSEAYGPVAASWLCGRTAVGPRGFFFWRFARMAGLV